LESIVRTLPGPPGYLTDWVLRAWAADLDLWADVFHLPADDAPSFGDLPLGPTLADSGRQSKGMLLMARFPGVLAAKYLGGLLLAKLAFYGDFHAEQNGGERVGGPYIGFRGPVTEPISDFTYSRDPGTGDGRLVTTPGGRRNVP